MKQDLVKWLILVGINVSDKFLKPQMTVLDQPQGCQGGRTLPDQDPYERLALVVPKFRLANGDSVRLGHHKSGACEEALFFFDSL